MKLINSELPSIDQLKISPNLSIKNTLKKINETSMGSCFVVKNDKIIGVVTDGDIRRGLLKGKRLNSPISTTMKKKFVFIKDRSLTKKINTIFKSGLKIVPIVKNNNILIDYVCNKRFHSVPISEPSLIGNEVNYVLDCLKTGWISSRGKYIEMFENKFAQFIGSQNTISCSSGTTALHLCLKSLGIKANDEVIVPNFTFIAPINAIIYCGAKPVLVDVDSRNYCLNVESLKNKITKKTKAIIIVHTYGYPFDVKEIKKIIKDKKIFIIEDCAEAIGSYVNGKHVGLSSDAGTFSFFGNKTISTGEGGLIVFKNKMHLKKAISLRNHSMSEKIKYYHTDVGFNYRITNMQAAIGLAQVEKIKKFINKKIQIAKLYEKFLSKNDRIILPQSPHNCQHSYWLYTILIKNYSHKDINKLINALNNKGIEIRQPFFPAHEMKPYKKYKKKKEKFTNSQKIHRSGLCLPSFYSLTYGQIKTISNIINNRVKKYN